MALLPENNSDRIAWFNNRTALWTTNAAAIGTTPTQVTDVAAKVTAATAALAAQKTAQDAAKAATDTLNLAIANLTNSGNIVIEQVRTQSRTAGDGVYPLANIPAPATPAPVGPPGTPGTFKVALQVDGSLDLSWKCANPAGCTGVVYQVWRRSTATGPFTYLGGTGVKKFTDSGLPAGSSQVTYQLQAVRSTSIGPWAQVNVNFGTAASGQMTASVVETTGKFAA